MNLGESWNSERNLPVAQKKLEQFACRTARSSSFSTNYVALSGVGPQSPFLPLTNQDCGAFGHDRQVNIATDIPDGMSCTIFLMETGQTQGSWASGHTPTLRWIDRTVDPQVGEGAPFGFAHGPCRWKSSSTEVFAVVGFGDGSARVISTRISIKALAAAVTIAGGEEIYPDW